MAKRRIAPLASGRVRVRLLEERDLKTTLAWRNLDEIRRWFFTTEVITPAQHHGWFAQYAERDDDFVFVIEEMQMLNRPVGQAAIYHVDWAAKRAEFGRLMMGDEEARGQGLAREATALLVDEALSRWGLEEIYLECHPANARALAIYVACGFVPAAESDRGILMVRRP